MRFGSSLVFASFLVASVPALAATWKVDSSHSAANFKIKHMMVTNVRGSISGIDGAVDIDDKDITKSKVNATLDAKTINTGDKKRDDHLRSGDFFNTDKNPKISFVSKKVEKAGEGKLKVSGDLTMNGVTKPVVLDVEGPTAPVKSPFGDVRRGLTATTTLNRKDYNINWNKTLDGGGVVVGDEVTIDLDLQLIGSDKPAH